MLNVLCRRRWGAHPSCHVHVPSARPSSHGTPPRRYIPSPEDVVVGRIVDKHSGGSCSAVEGSFLLSAPNSPLQAPLTVALVFLLRACHALSCPSWTALASDQRPRLLLGPAENYGADIGAPFRALLPVLAFEGATKRNRPHLQASGQGRHSTPQRAQRDRDGGCRAGRHGWLDLPAVLGPEPCMQRLPLLTGPSCFISGPCAQLTGLPEAPGSHCACPQAAQLTKGRIVRDLRRCGSGRPWARHALAAQRLNRAPTALPCTAGGRPGVLPCGVCSPRPGARAVLHRRCWQGARLAALPCACSRVANSHVRCGSGRAGALWAGLPSSRCRLCGRAGTGSRVRPAPCLLPSAALLAVAATKACATWFCPAGLWLRPLERRHDD